MANWLAFVGKHRRIAYPVAGLLLLLGLSGGVLAETGTLTGTTTPAPSASGSAQGASTAANGATLPAAGGAVNVVQVSNTTDNSLDARGKDQFSQIGGPNVAPQNIAIAYSSCVKCQAIAVALQVVLIKPSPSNFQPHNAAVAVNFGCTGCYSCAFAFQQVVTVPDFSAIPASVRREAAEVHADLANLAATVVSKGFSNDCPGVIAWATTELQPELNAVAPTDFKHDAQTAPTTPGATSVPPSPPATASASPTVSGSPTESPTPQPTATP